LASLYVSTTGTDVELTEFGTTLVHPVTDEDLTLRFSSDEISQCQSLTDAILAGTLVWKRTLAGGAENASDYDPDYVEITEHSDGPSTINQTFKQGEQQVYLGEDTNHLLERIGGVIKITIPDSSSKPTYDGNDNLTVFEVYTTATQTVANRRVRGDYTYTGDNLTEEEYKIYSESDGTTILRTITVTHTYDGNDFLTNTTVVEV